MFFKVVGRLTIRFFRGLGRGTINLGRFTFRHPITMFFTLVAIAGVVALLFVTNFFGIANSTTGLIQNDPSVTDSPHEASTLVLKGLTAFNAAEMWSGFSDDYRQTLAKNGLDQGKLQQAIDAMRKQNQTNNQAVTYKSFTFQGSGNLRDGSGRADIFESTMSVGGREVKANYALKLDSKDRIRDVLSDDNFLGGTLFATTVRSANPLIKPSAGSVDLLLGLAKNDAKELVSALNDQYREEMASQGLDDAAIQATLDKNLRDAAAKPTYDHFTMRGNSTTNGNVEQYASFSKPGNTSPLYTYQISLDSQGQVIEVSSNDPVIQSIFFTSVVSSSDPNLKPRSAGAQALQGLSKYDAKTIWGSLSDDYKNALTAEGFDQAAMQKAMDSTIKELDAIGEKPQYTHFELTQAGQLRDTGENAETYDVGVKIGNRDTTTTFIIKYDNNNKITSVISQDPLASIAFHKPKSSANLPQTGFPLQSPNYTAERLMLGLTTFDVQKVWASLSPSYQKELNDQGVNPNTMTSVFNQFKQEASQANMKLSYVGYSFQKGISYPAGNSEASYTSTLQYGDRAGQFDYLLILDANNKIQAITTTDPILNALLGRQQSSTNG